MRISLDVSQAVYEGTGSGRYVVELVRELLRLDPDNHYLLFGSALGKSEQLSSFFENCKKINSNNVDYLKLPFPPKLFEIVWNKFHRFSIDKFVGKSDIYHSSDWTQSPSKALKITTVHDLIPFLYPEYVHPRIIEAHKARWKWIEKEIDIVIVDAEVTKKDILDRFKIDQSKIKVIPLACDKRFFDLGENKISGKNIFDNNEQADILNQYSLKQEKYILSVGTLEPRKNIKRLIEAYQKLSEELRNQYPLVIVGKKAWAAEFLNDKNIIFTGYVDDHDLPYLYSGSKCFVMPSLYEGFGLPVLEAMASGTPVICSDRSSLPEIGGDDVHYIQDPENIEPIFVVLSHVLQSEVSELQKIATSAFGRAKQFSWERSARATLEIYNQSN